MRTFGVTVTAVVLASALTPGCSEEDRVQATCYLTVEALALVADAVSRGRQWGDVVRLFDDGLQRVCQSELTTLVNRPTAALAVTVRLPDGVTRSLTTSGRAIAAPPPRPAPSALRRMVACSHAYPNSQVLFRFCVDGWLTP